MGITSSHCYLPPDTGERFKPQPDRPVLDLFIPKGWKVELILVVYIGIVYLSADSHPSSPSSITT